MCKRLFCLYFAIIFYSLNLYSECNRPKLLLINNQSQFDSLSKYIVDNLKQGERKIKIKIKKGLYYYKEGHINLNDLNYSDADISIEGDDAVIVPSGCLLHNGDSLPGEVSGESCFLDIKRKKTISPWSDLMYADSLVEIVDTIAKVCRFKCKKIEKLEVPKNNDTYIDLTRWCRCFQYKVDKIENGYIYFYAHDLQLDSVFHKPYYNINYDYVFAKKRPRFRFCNTTANKELSVIGGRLNLPKNIKAVHIGNSSLFLAANQSKFHSLSVERLTFLGSKQSIRPLLFFKNTVSTLIEFSECRFIGQMGRIMILYATDNINFHDNYISDNYEWGIVSDHFSSNTTIKNNTFENNGTGLSYARCVSCSGENYYIANNIFKNFGYCAISIGLGYYKEKQMHSSGIVEYNQMYYDYEHFTNSWKYTIMDSGAIYLWTQNDDSTIRYNYIHDYTGMAQNNGIFCDDGASNFKIYGNVIINTPNYYSINSRRVAGTEKANHPNSFVERNNVNNLVMYNVTDCPIYFAGREEEHNGCVKGMNVILQNKKSKREERKIKTTYKNLEVEDDDITMEFNGISKGKVMLDKKTWNKLKKELPCFEKIKRYLKK